MLAVRGDSQKTECSLQSQELSLPWWVGRPGVHVSGLEMEANIMGYNRGLYWGYIGVMEKMETTIMGHSRCCGLVLRKCVWGRRRWCCWDFFGVLPQPLLFAVTLDDDWLRRVSCFRFTNERFLVWRFCGMSCGQ